MSKVRINDLARELEVKSRAILDALTHVGVTEKKTHSSSLEEDEAERVRQHFQRTGKNGAGAAKVVDSEPKQKIDWSRVSKPGDVLKAIQQRKDEAAAIAQRPPVPQHSPRWSGLLQPVRLSPVGLAPLQWPARPQVCPQQPRLVRRQPHRPPARPPSHHRCASGQGSPVQARPNLGGPTLGGQGQQRTPSSAPSAAPDRSPAPAGAADRGSPAAARARHCRETARWASGGQATRFGCGSEATGELLPAWPALPSQATEVRPPAASQGVVAAAPQQPRAQTPQPPLPPQVPSAPEIAAAAAAASAQASPAVEAAAPQAQAPAPPPPPAARRVIMPQTGPRPVYQAPPPPPVTQQAAPSTSSGIPATGRGHPERTANLRSWPARRWTRIRSRWTRL